MEPDFTVIAAAAEDIPRITEIEKLCFSDPWSEDAFVEALTLDNYIFLTVKTGTDIAGYAMAYTVADESHILNIAVLPEFRKLGIGRSLMNRIFEKSIDASVFYLEVRQSNTPALALYESLGFVKNAIRRRYYKNPVEDAVLMSRTV